ncbi:MAG: NAD-dependent epimerase/dehydratase family protein [Gemmatimonadota bacterium]
MAGETVLVTGGAGFVGGHLVEALLARGERVRILDSLDSQVHGRAPVRPAWLPAEAELMIGDVRDPEVWPRALREVGAVYHLAAAVGVGQSMYRVADYVAVNALGTANLLQALVDGSRELKRLVVASSMSIYAEGRYARPDGAEPCVQRRPAEQLRQRQWELRDLDGTPLEPRPTDEAKPLDPMSIYALTKADQERMVLQIAAAYGIPAVALRFFNIYGPRQALSNPYTGVAAIFSARLLNGRPPLVFEDGHQRRDFVSVHDVVEALLLAGDRNGVEGQVLNVGSGRAVTVLEVAETLARVLGSSLEPRVTGRCRVGDVRHCTADVTRARAVLGYQPRVSFETGMEELVAWLGEQELPEDGVSGHAADLTARGLTI